jgi:hypothetical protein
MNNERNTFHQPIPSAPETSWLSGSNTALIVVYLLLLTAHIALVWILPYFPTQDGPSHLYNLAILQDLVNGGAVWGEFFDYEIRAIPNWGFHIFAYPLLKLFSPLVVEKIFLSVFIILLGMAVPYFLVTFGGRVFPLSFLVFPVIFNFNLMMGFYSYVIAVPLLLLGVSINWRVKNRHFIYKVFLLNSTGFILYGFHFVTFCLFLIAVFLMPLVEFKKTRDFARDIIKISVAMFPSLVLLLSYLLMSLKSEMMSIPSYYSFTYFLELFAKLPAFSIFTFSHWQAVPYAFLIVLYVWLAGEKVKEKTRLRTFTAAEKYILCFMATAALIYFVMPFNFGSGSYFNQRFPWVLFLFSLPLLRIPVTGLLCRYKSHIVVFLAASFFVFNSVILYQESCRVERYLSGLSFNIPKGSYVMSYIPKTLRWSRVNVLLHAVSYYCLAHQCVDIGNYEARMQYFPVHFKNSNPILPHYGEIAYAPRTVIFSDYPAIDYVISFDIEKADAEKISHDFQLVWSDDPLSIWQRERHLRSNKYKPDEG